MHCDLWKKSDGDGIRNSCHVLDGGHFTVIWSEYCDSGWAKWKSQRLAAAELKECTCSGQDQHVTEQRCLVHRLEIEGAAEKQNPLRLGKRKITVRTQDPVSIFQFCWIEGCTKINYTLGCFKNILFPKKNKCNPVRTPPGYI